MMCCIDFLTQPEKVSFLLKQYLENCFTPDTLVINDTRGMILPEVLPFIEFVCTYDQRILSLLSHTNIVLSDPFDREVLKYYQRFGLSQNLVIFLTKNDKHSTLAKSILLDAPLLKELKEKKFKKIIPFFVNTDMEALGASLEVPLSVSKEVFEAANDKLLLKKYLLSQNLPTIAGEMSGERDILKGYFESETRYLFKDPLGVSGYGFWDNTEHTFEELEQNYAGKELIIEAFVEKESSPSVQFFIDADQKTAVIFGITDQILENGKIYLGNTSPSQYVGSKIGDELIRQSKQILEYIFELGYTGFGGIDFIVSSKQEVYATEVNARFTGATYPLVTAFLLTQNLTNPWKFYNYDGPKKIVGEFLQQDAISSKNMRGIFPLSISGISQFGKANLLEFI